MGNEHHSEHIWSKKWDSQWNFGSPFSSMKPYQTISNRQSGWTRPCFPERHLQSETSHLRWPLGGPSGNTLGRPKLKTWKSLRLKESLIKSHDSFIFILSSQVQSSNRFVLHFFNNPFTKPNIPIHDALSGVSCRKPPLRNRRSPKTNGAKQRFLARFVREDSGCVDKSDVSWDEIIFEYLGIWKSDISWNVGYFSLLKYLLDLEISWNVGSSLMWLIQIRKREKNSKCHQDPSRTGCFINWNSHEVDRNQAASYDVGITIINHNKPAMTGNGWYPNYKYLDDWEMVCGINLHVFLWTSGTSSRISLKPPGISARPPQPPWRRWRPQRVIDGTWFRPSLVSTSTIKCMKMSGITWPV